MKKALRVGGKFLKVYVALTILMWAYVGLAEWFNWAIDAIERKGHIDAIEEVGELLTVSTNIWKGTIKGFLKK